MIKGYAICKKHDKRCHYDRGVVRERKGSERSAAPVLKGRQVVNVHKCRKPCIRLALSLEGCNLAG